MHVHIAPRSALGVLGSGRRLVIWNLNSFLLDKAILLDSNWKRTQTFAAKIAILIDLTLLLSLYKRSWLLLPRQKGRATIVRWAQHWFIVQLASKLINVAGSLYSFLQGQVLLLQSFILHQVDSLCRYFSTEGEFNDDVQVVLVFARQLVVLNWFILDLLIQKRHCWVQLLYFFVFKLLLLLFVDY